MFGRCDAVHVGGDGIQPIKRAEAEYPLASTWHLACSLVPVEA